MLSEKAATALLLATLPAHCCLEWCWYEGEHLVAQPNLEATQREHRAALRSAVDSWNSVVAVAA